MISFRVIIQVINYNNTNNFIGIHMSKYFRIPEKLILYQLLK